MPIEQYLSAALLLLVSIAAVNDLGTRRIPNRLLLVGMAVALLLYLLSPTPGEYLLTALGGMALGLAVFLPFYLLRGMAAGDVKMMAVVGFFTSPGQVLEIAVLSWCAGGVMALVLVLAHGQLRSVLGNIRRILLRAMTPDVGVIVPAQQTSVGSMPYGLAIAAGTVVALVRHYG